MTISDRPNIVWFFLDDGSPTCLDKCTYINGLDTVDFSRSYLYSPLCTPSRGQAYTGWTSQHSGVLDNDNIPAHDPRATIAQALKRRGYQTWFLGKYANNHRTFVDSFFGARIPGWDIFTEKSGNYTDVSFTTNGGAERTRTGHVGPAFRDEALSYLTTAPADPFFLFFATTVPHNPIGSVNDGMPVPTPGTESDYAGETYRPPNHNEGNISDKAQWLKSLFPSTRSGADINDLDECRRDEWRAMVSTDDAVQQIIARLTTLGLMDDTIIIISNDNGHSRGEHRLGANGSSGAKGHYYAEALVAHMRILHPDIAGRTETALVSHLDIPATIADLAGAQMPLAPDGMSLVPLLENPGMAWRTDLMHASPGTPWGVPAWQGITSLVDGTLVKYVEIDGSSDKELFDLDADPWELVNIVTTNTALRDTMAARLAVLQSELT